MYTNARTFLQKVLPWETPSAFFNLHWKTTKLDRFNKPIWNSRAYLTLEEMIKGLGWIVRLPDARDIYVCMSAQSQCDERVSKTNNKYRLGVRGAINAVALKSLFIDVDVKPGAYSSTEEALAATQKFIDDSGLPMPTACVASGSGGFHLHWTLAQPLKRDKWQILANALAECVRANGLITDSGCTIDSARVLRVPETLNYKLDPPAPVSLMSLSPTEITLDQLAPALKQYIGVTPVGKLAPDRQELPFPRLPPIIGESDLAGGIDDAPPKDIDDVARNCAFIDHALRTNGADYDNPQWFLSLRVAIFCEDSRNVAHDLSSGHPDYSADDTDAEFDRAERDRNERGIGWPACAKIDAAGSKFCRSCKFFPQGKSPLHFATPDAPAPVTPQAPTPPSPPQVVNSLPPPYQRDMDGFIWIGVQDEDTGQTTDVKICDYPLTDGWLQNNPWVLHFTTVTHTGKRTKIEFPLAEFGTMGGVGKVLSVQGVVMSDSKIKATKEFLMAWTQHLQQQKGAVVSATPFGWSVVDGKTEGFTYAGRVWGDGFDRPAAIPDAVLSKNYSPHGEMDPWMVASKIITNQKRPGLDAILAAAFGGPLVRITGEPGVQMCTWSGSSGVGKTTALRTAQAVWGHPIKAANGLSDTVNSTLNKLGKIKHIPLFWDEFKGDRDMDTFARFGFTLSGGKEKNRLKSDLTQKEGGDWQTMMISTSNDTLVDAIGRLAKSNTAGLYRLFEYEILPGTQGKLEQTAVSRAVGRLNENHGHAGLLYAKFIGANYPRIVQEVSDLQDALAREVKSKEAERFWVVTITVILAGAKYANELGLTDIDEAALKEHMLKVLQHMRGLVSETPTDMKNQLSVSTVLAQYLGAMRARHTLVTDRINVAAGKPAPRQIKGDTSKLEDIHVQVGLDDRLMRVSSTHLSRWLAEHEHPRHAFTEALKKEFGVKQTNGRLGSGTTFAGATQYLLEINLNDPRLANVLE